MPIRIPLPIPPRLHRAFRRVACVLAALPCLLWAVPGHALEPFLTPSQLHHTAWRGKDGAPTNILAIAQTTDGFLWLGTGGGLFRFDGVRFERIGLADGQAVLSNSISALYATPTGKLLIGHRFGGVSILDRSGLQHFVAADGLPGNNAHAFVLDADGAIWGAFSDGIARFRAGVWQPFALDGESVPSRTMLIDAEGSIWVTARTGAYVLPRGAAAFQRVEAELPPLSSLSLAPDGRVWAADAEHRRIRALVREGSRFSSQPERERIPFPATGDRHWFDSQGGLWIQTGEGILRLPHPAEGAAAGAGERQQPMQVFGKAQGLTGDVNCLLEDREGNIWVGTAGGLDQFRHGNVRRIDLGASEGGVGVAPGDNGHVWATTMFGGLFRIGDSVEAFPQVAPRASHIHRDREGVVWIGSRGGLWEIRGRSPAARVPWPDSEDFRKSVAFAPIHAIAKDRSGALWVSFVVKGSYRKRGDQWTRVPDPLGDRIMSMGNDREGRLWIGYYGGAGAARVDGDEVRTFTARGGLNIGAVMAIFGRGDRVWLGGERGLALYDGRSMRTLSLKGLEDIAGVSGIVETEAGQLWINAAGGLIEIDAQEWRKALADPDHKVQVERFDAQDGLLGSASQIRPLPSLVEGGDGRLWAALPLGLFVVDPARLQRNRLAPAVIIRGLFVEGRRFEPDSAAELPVGNADLRFDYTATSLTIPERVRFRYKLEGYDRDWRDAGDRREAVYTRVGPGNYVFRVIASNNDGVWNEAGDAMAFAVAPAFWQTPWFAALACLLAACVAWVLYRLRIRQISTRLRGRMDERLRERERIARELHDTLLQGVTGLTLHVRAAANQVPEGSPLRDKLELALRRANDVIVEGRDRVSELRVPSRLRTELASALSDACDELGGMFPGPACRLAVDGSARELRPLVAEEVYRIAREALANAFVHSGCRTIELQLRYGDGALGLTVRDDGSGFDAGSPAVTGRPGHFGLAGMRERAARIGARLRVETGAQGTEVELVVPASQAYGAAREDTAP